MKKMIAGLLGLVLSVSFVMPSFAQNKVNRYDSMSVGAPSYTMNSGGSFYGQVVNSASASNWSLGFGSSQSTSGTSVLSWNSSGHIFISGIGTPVVSSCGTNPSVVSGSDQAGDLTLGSTAVATCTLTFTAAFTTIPHCFATNRTSNLVTLAQPTASTLVFEGSSSSGPFGNANDVIDYFCIGHAS